MIAPLKLLEEIVFYLAKHEANFALAGGLAASLYRTKPRLTNDVDIALVLGSEKTSKEFARKIFKEAGYKVSLGWITSNDKRNVKPISLVIGQPSKNDLESSVDFILPNLPWVERAVKRAADNIIDFGFAKIPTLTPEDLIIAKAFALELDPSRFQDLDDIKSIFQAKNELDYAYLLAEFERHELRLAKALREHVPKALSRLVER